MRIYKFTLFLLLITYGTSYASKDFMYINIDTLQNRSIRTSDLIFLGKLTTVDTINETLSFEILEIFKGDYNSKSISIGSEKHNVIYFFDKSLWLVYANYNNDSTYFLNKNGLTRSILHPETIQTYAVPPPPPENSNNNVYDLMDKMVDFKVVPLKDWYVELELLRDYKRQNMNVIDKSVSNFKTYFYISVILNTLCIVLIVILLLRTKGTNH